MRFKIFLEQEENYWYQGRSVNSTEFNHKFIDQKGNRQDGPGFYFTRSEEDARQYATGDQGIVLKCILTPKKLVSRDKEFSNKELEKIMKMSPNFQDYLMNWDENPNKAFKMAFEQFSNMDDSVELVQSLWADLYDEEDIAFLNNMIKLGYDGTESLTTTWDHPHVIIFNPNVIEVVETK